MTLDASSENVLATIPPHPRSYERAITLPLVPGGPEPSTNGFSNFMPLTVILRSVTSPPRGPREPETVGLTQPESPIQSRMAGFAAVAAPRGRARAARPPCRRGISALDACAA